MKKLTVLYDADCAFCRRCRAWLLRQATFLELEFVPADSWEVERRFPGLEPSDTPDELVAISDEGGVYRGPHAFIMCLYALRKYRDLALWLARPWVRPLARQALGLLSSQRGLLSRFLTDSGSVERLLQKELVCSPGRKGPGTCGPGACGVG